MRRLLNDDGFIVPPPMRNYQERDILCGFIKLTRYDRMDLFWGRIKDVERDFIYAHLFVMSMMLIILIYVLVHSANETQKFYGNI